MNSRPSRWFAPRGPGSSGLRTGPGPQAAHPAPTTHMLMLKLLFSRRIASASFCWIASSEPTSYGQRRERGQPQPPPGRTLAHRPRTAKTRAGPGPTWPRALTAGPGRGKGRRRDDRATTGPTRRTAELSIGSLSKGRSTDILTEDSTAGPPEFKRRPRSALRRRRAGGVGLRRGAWPKGRGLRRGAGRGWAGLAARARLRADGRGRCGAGGDPLTACPGSGGAHTDHRVQLPALHRNHTAGPGSSTGHTMCLQRRPNAS